MTTKSLIFAAVILAPRIIFAAESDDVRKDLAVIQAKIAEEEARYQAAKAAMERSQIIAQYVFPELRKREQELQHKIEQIEKQAPKK